MVVVVMVTLVVVAREQVARLGLLVVVILTARVEGTVVLVVVSGGRRCRVERPTRRHLVANVRKGARAAALLDETLQEESQTDEDLTSIADAAVNAEALSSAA